MRCRRKLERALALLAVLSAALSPAIGSAQGGGIDRGAREGPGFKAGRLVLHPGLALEGGYDSNVFLQDVNEEDSFILRLTGYLDVATEGTERQSQGETNKAEPQKIQFRGGLGASYYHYFMDRLPDNVGADAHVDFAYNPSQVFSLQVRDIFRRTVRPFSDPNTADGTTISYGFNHNTASLALVGRSKSKVLEGRLGYTNALEFFDSDIYAYGNNMTHRVPASLSWRFFPSSALVYGVEYIRQNFANPDQIAASPTLLSDNNRVRSSIAYNGALTERFSLTAMIGYSAGFYELASDFDGVIARLDTRWRPRSTISLTAGYARDIRPSFIGNFTTTNRLHANAGFTLSGALQLGLTASVSFDKSGLALSPDGTLLGNEPYREDIRVYAGIFGEYRFKPWLALFGQVGYLADFTDFQYFGTDPLLDPAAGYQRFEAWLGLRVFY
ncbi:hypothetical protein N9917_04710 [Deltaproteobacteria bacterium]|nr:hypothetical protein [Deltaproteobacteria bacterium]